MYGVEKILEGFHSGRLVRPSVNTLNFVDLVGALARAAGVDGIDPGEGVRQIDALIPPARHYVFVLIDGMGMSILEKAPLGGFLRSRLVGELQAVFPSTTSAALTTMATGQWPCCHGVPGWWVYLEPFGLSATVLPFVERFGGRCLAEFGLTAGDVFGLKSIWAGAPCELLSVLPDNIVDSVFARYASGGTPRAGYRTFGEAMELIKAHVLDAGARTFTYLYLPQLDSQAHQRGTEDRQIADLLATLEGQLKKLRDDLPADARLVISADHGLTDTPPDRRFILGGEDALTQTLTCPPTGDPAMPIFHIKPGREGPFLDCFDKQFAEAFALITPAEAEQLRLFGPGPLCQQMRQRLGNFIALAFEPAAIFLRPPGGRAEIHLAVHSGLSPRDMTIPLIIA